MNVPPSPHVEEDDFRLRITFQILEIITAGDHSVVPRADKKRNAYALQRGPIDKLSAEVSGLCVGYGDVREIVKFRLRLIKD